MKKPDNEYILYFINMKLGIYQKKSCQKKGFNYNLIAFLSGINQVFIDVRLF